MAHWLTRQHLLDHFQQHGREMGCHSAEDYTASAQATLDVGTYFTYFDAGAGVERLGCFDRDTGRFVVLSDDDNSIVSHFRCSERYVRRLPYNNYDG